MRTWRRAVIGGYCGGCGQAYAVGAAIQELQFGPITKIRGECCEGSAPPELLPLVTREAEIWKPFVHIRTGANVLPFDFKARAAGDREPGEEG